MKYMKKTISQHLPFLRNLDLIYFRPPVTKSVTKIQSSEQHGWNIATRLFLRQHKYLDQWRVSWYIVFISIFWRQENKSLQHILRQIEELKIFSKTSKNEIFNWSPQINRIRLNVQIFRNIIFLPILDEEIALNMILALVKNVNFRGVPQCARGFDYML